MASLLSFHGIDIRFTLPQTMSFDIINPDYNWKQAAAQEGVDYGAVQKSFMDQSYGVVANKAKILFQDPFRLGFEIVHRNEKATKMVGIFAFRVNQNLLYAPTFFVNGEIKPADMLYRSDVKRFVPLTEDWCAYLVRGVHESAGEPVNRDRLRQADAYMDRLASPQRVKYASEMDYREAMHECEAALVDLSDEFGPDLLKLASSHATAGALLGVDDNWVRGMAEARDAFVKAAKDGSLWLELVTHCADETAVKKILPEVINEHGPEALEKLASMIGDSDTVARFVAKTYTREELESVDAWMAKEAADVALPAITIVTDPCLAKSASEREVIFDKGYGLIDDRPAETLNMVVEEIGDGSIRSLKPPGKASVMLDDGSLVDAYMFYVNDDIFTDTEGQMSECHPGDRFGSSVIVYFPDTKQRLSLGYAQEVFGDELLDDRLTEACTADKLTTGKVYMAISLNRHHASGLLSVRGKSKSGECTTITYNDGWGRDRKLYYAEGRRESSGEYVSDDLLFVEVKCEKPKSPDDDPEPICDRALMSASGINDWMRTSGGVTSSRDVRVKPRKTVGTFDIEHSENGTILKKANDMGWLEAHLALAEDFNITTDKAGEILEKAVNGDVAYRVFDTCEKRAYLTRPEGMQQWIEAFDPELQVRVDAPQKQVLSTHTPRRPDQSSRYGDTYQRPDAKNSDSGDDLLPMDAVLSKSPEELAHLSDVYDMPHIFDHSCVGQMATSTSNVVEQVKKYVPDLETGVDRYFRILFLLRYRPSDFEEHYGKDDLVEFEQDLTDLASQAGEHLLKILRRFEPDQYASQEN